MGLGRPVDVELTTHSEEKSPHAWAKRDVQREGILWVLATL